MYCFAYFLLQKKLRDLEIAHSNDAWIKEKENMKRNLDESLKEIKTLNTQCSHYEDQIELLKKDVRKIINNQIGDINYIIQIKHFF